jgi:hypothetical protein
MSDAIHQLGYPPDYHFRHLCPEYPLNFFGWNNTGCLRCVCWLCHRVSSEECGTHAGAVPPSWKGWEEYKTARSRQPTSFPDGEKTQRVVLSKATITISSDTLYDGIPGAVINHYLAQGPASSLSLARFSHTMLRIPNMPNLETAVQEISKSLPQDCTDVMYGCHSQDLHCASNITFDVVRGNELRLLSPEPGHCVVFGGLAVDAAIAAAKLSNVRLLPYNPPGASPEMFKQYGLTPSQSVVLQIMFRRETCGATSSFWSACTPDGVCVSRSTKSIACVPVGSGLDMPDSRVNGGILIATANSGRKRLVFALIHSTRSHAAAWAMKKHNRLAQTIVVTPRPDKWEAEAEHYNLVLRRNEIVGLFDSVSFSENARVVTLVTPAEFQVMSDENDTRVWRVIQDHDSLPLGTTSISAKRAWVLSREPPHDTVVEDLVLRNFKSGTGVVQVYARHAGRPEAFSEIVRNGITVYLKKSRNSTLTFTTCVVRVWDPALSDNVRCENTSAMFGVCSGKAPKGTDRFWRVTEEQRCPICHGVQTNAARPNGCAHKACRQCLEQWKTAQVPPPATCMLCRAPFEEILLEGVPALDVVASTVKLDRIVQDIRGLIGKIVILSGFYDSVTYLRAKVESSVCVKTVWMFEQETTTQNVDEHVTLILTDVEASKRCTLRKLYERFACFGKPTSVLVMTYVVENTQEAEEMD